VITQPVVVRSRFEDDWPRDLAELRRIELAFGSVPERITRETAARYGVSPGTISSWRQGRHSPRATFQLAEDDLIEICRRGDVRKGWRARNASGDVEVGYHTFWRAWKEQPPAIRAGLLKDVRSMRAHQMFGTHPREGRNALWLADNSMSNNYVWVPGFRKPRRAWHTFIVDSASHLAWMAVVDEAVNAEAITATVASAVVTRRHPNGVVTGGIPVRLKHDLGRDYLATSQINMLTRLETRAIQCEAYSPWEKGLVEETVKAILGELCPPLPGFVRTYVDGQPAPWHPDDGPLLDFQQYVELAFRALEDYNNRPQVSLGGKSPLEAYAASDIAIRWLEDESDEALARLFLRKGDVRTAGKDGIRFRNADWVEPWLYEHKGKRLTLGYPENLNQGVLHDGMRGLYVFDGEDFLGIVRDARDRTPAEGKELKNARRRQVATVQRIHKKAAKLRESEADRALGREPAPPPEKSVRDRASMPRAKVIEGLTSRLV
jgi:hypothetical protein